MSSADQAVSEILSFIIILGIIALGITVYAAAVLPEMEKSAEIEYDNQLSESLLSLKTGIDKLWILGGENSGTMFLPGSEMLRKAGTIQIKEGGKLLLDHENGSKTASLLFVSVNSESRNLNQNRYTLEGGAVFYDGMIFLPNSGSENNVKIICFTGEEQTLSANCPITIFYTYKSSEIFRNITNLTVSSSENQNYWKERLSKIKDITILDYEVWMEAAS